MSIFTAKRIPVHRGPAAWSVILPGQEAPVVLESNLKADFVIIGAGFAGLSAARRLTQLAPKSKIAVLEAGRIGEGACARNAGFMIDLPHEIGGQGYDGDGPEKNKRQIALNRKAITFARSAVEEYCINSNYFDPAGKTNGAAGPDADALNRAYAKSLADIGEASTYLDAKAMQDMTGSAYYTSGLFTPGCVMIQPAGYIRGVVSGLRKAGIGIFEHTPAVTVESAGSGWKVSTPKHTVSAGKVIFATNGHLESFGFAKQRLMHIFLYASMTVDFGADTLKKLGGKPRWGVTPSDPMGTTMRRLDSPLGGNRIITRTCVDFLPGMEPSEANLARTMKVQRRNFDARFPALKDVEMEHSWAGHLCLSRNGVAVTRELEKNLYSACVQNGLGTVRGTMTGMAAAELACRVESDFTRHFTAEAEPTKLPPPPLSTLGATAYLRYKEWKARRE